MADWRPIALNPNPVLSEDSPLRSIAPLRICVWTFKDNSNLGKNNKVGSRPTSRLGTGAGLAFFRIDNIPNIPRFLSQALACDFFVYGILKELAIEDIPLPSKVKALIVVDLWLHKGQDRNALFTQTYTGTYTKAGYKDEISTAHVFVAEALDQAILDWLHNISQDQKLSDALNNE